MKTTTKYSSNPIMMRFLRSKELHDSMFLHYHSQLSSMKTLIDRLGLECELSGHGGCVNCIEWNREGNILASGSDDYHVMLWDPFKKKQLADIDTGHQGNIFSVKFMPYSMNHLVASGAGDGKVKVHCVERASDPSARPDLDCSCHASRVKRLAIAPDVPFLLWSGAEDGTVMQYDLRDRHTCSSGPSSILVNLLSHCGKLTEIKSISINPVRPELLAVGANDPYVRLYDRRMIKLTSIQYLPERPLTSWGRHDYFSSSSLTEESRSAIPANCVKYFIPGYLPPKLEMYKRRYRSLASTYVTFDPTGRYLLANIGGEHIYLYDIYSPKQAFNELPNLGEDTSKALPLPSCLEQLKCKANAAFQQRQFTTAIGLYGKALLKAPRTAVLYSNRAAAFLRRNWDGDSYAALRDCCSALKLDKGQMKAFHRLVRCLLDLGQPVLAEKALKLLKENHPTQVGNSFVLSLEKELEQKLAKHSQKLARNGSLEEDGETPSNDRPSSISPQERAWRSQAWDYTSRYCGHCNTTTDIKEANFFGNDGQYIVAGSDDGCFFIWDRHSGVVERVLRGDEAIVNCLQPHPSICLLATSGIDPVIRLWAPLPQEPTTHDRVGSVFSDFDSVGALNQRRMNADPFEMLLMSMVPDSGDDHDMPEIGVRRRPPPSALDDDERDANEPAIQCRQS